MQAFIRLAIKIIINTLLYVFRLCRVRDNRVMLINSLAKNYSDNPKYVVDKLREKYGDKHEVVIVFGNMDNVEEMHKRGFKVVKLNSLKYFYYAMTSKVFISTAIGFSYIPFRKSQTVINLWHGGGAYKKVGLDMYKNSRLYKYDLKMNADRTTIFVSSSKKFSEVMSRSMMIPRERFWEIGMPRNDMLVKRDPAQIADVKKKLGVDSDKKIVLYCPTYRKPKDNYFNESVAATYGLDPEGLCKALSDRFGGEWIFAYRMHPVIKDENDEFKGKGLRLTRYPDMQELLLVADVMINDFSSSMWDYMLTERPCFLFATDMDHYIATTELYTPIDDLPYPTARSNEELQQRIRSFDAEDYKRRCDKNYADFGGCETGRASELVADKINELSV